METVAARLGSRPGPSSPSSSATVAHTTEQRPRHKSSDSPHRRKFHTKARPARSSSNSSRAGTIPDAVTRRSAARRLSTTKGARRAQLASVRPQLSANRGNSKKWRSTDQTAGMLPRASYHSPPGTMSHRPSAPALSERPSPPQLLPLDEGPLAADAPPPLAEAAGDPAGPLEPTGSSPSVGPSPPVLSTATPTTPALALPPAPASPPFAAPPTPDAAPEVPVASPPVEVASPPSPL
jgi:hypothetical protein